MHGTVRPLHPTYNSKGRTLERGDFEEAAASQLPWGASALLGPFPRPAPKVRPSVPPSGLGRTIPVMPPLATWIDTSIDYLDDHTGAFTALLTAVLILVTIYYSYETRHMVTEMAKTRELAILPKLALEFRRLGPAGGCGRR